MRLMVIRLLAIVAVGFALPMQSARAAESADGLVAKNLAARGGAAKLAASRHFACAASLSRRAISSLRT